MRILLSEGSGLTSRQVARLLVAAGHQVGVLSADPIGLTRFTGGLSGWHRVPPFGRDPVRWLNRAVQIYRDHGYQMLFPTQEQVAVLASRPGRLSVEGVSTVVPDFAALRAVQDKSAARATLDRLGIAQPASTVLTSERELRAWAQFPVYLKSPIGTATSGVHRLDSRVELRELLRRLAREGTCVLVSSHLLADLEELADRVVFVDRGATVGEHRLDALPLGAVLRPWRVRALDQPALLSALQRNAYDFDDPTPAGVDVHLAGDDAAAQLLAGLVRDGVPVVAFQPLGGALEAAYLSLTEEAR